MWRKTAYIWHGNHSTDDAVAGGIGQEGRRSCCAALPAYSSRFSRQDFTQHQLFALMVLGTFLKLDHRGIIAVVKDWSDVRQAIGLKKVPHWSTLYKAQQRLLKKVCSTGCWTQSSTTPSNKLLSARKRKPASTLPDWKQDTARRIMPTK